MAEDSPETQRRQYGHSRSYIIDRLKRANRTDFVDAIERGEISAHTAAIEMGWVRRPPAVGASNTHQARRRRVRLQAIAGGGSVLSQMQELWLGPNSSHGSLFGSREELQSAWQQHRAEVMRLWGSHGRRPMAWWEFEAGNLEYPGYHHEQSYLFEHNAFSEAERTELLAGWRKEFEHACSLEGAARKSHLDWADVPHSLRQQWQAARKRRSGRQLAAPSEAAAEKAPSVASSAEGEEETTGLRPEFNAAAGTLE
jgi:hypothetical protein